VRLAAGVAAGAIAGPAWAGDTFCGYGAGECDEPHPTPGCDFAECCQQVCQQLPECCEVAWDENCVAIAAAKCDPPYCPGKGSCTAVHGTGGCDDELCCELICEVDFYCCYALWDQICAAEGALLCGVAPCEVTCPPEAVPEPELCGEDTNGGCPSSPDQFTPLACGQTYCGASFAEGWRDTDWYELILTEERAITFTVSAEFPVSVMTIEGTCAGYTVTSAAHGVGCAPAVLTYCARPGTHYLIIAPGTAQGPIFYGAPCPSRKGFPPGPYSNDYVATLTCAGCGNPCPSDVNDNGVVEIKDVLAVLGNWGPVPPGGHPADVDGNGSVDIFDLLEILGNWGDCPPRP
jgi:hypothetical protein